MRHDGPKNEFAFAAKEASRDVEIEPELQPLSGEVFEMKTAVRSFGATNEMHSLNLGFFIRSQRVG